MLFRSKRSSATWDTWMYYANGKYYLYYLITEHSPGEGFGVAVSEDGVHFQDCGIQLSASDKMLFYLGTGAVWKKLPFDGTYLCNFSEWRERGTGREQQIFFASSTDLIHWEKLDEKDSVRIDPRYYQTRESEAARWDCINPLRTADGYLGYWTARPYDRPGIGLGRSRDGLHWEVLPPPDLDGSVLDGMELEAGSVMANGNAFYMLVGSYGHAAGIAVLTAPEPRGRYTLQKASPYLFANQEYPHAYFARFFETPEGVLVNFHVLLRKANSAGRSYTYMAPLKRVDIDPNGILRLKWWHGNERLIGRRIDRCGPACVADTSGCGKIRFVLDDGAVRTLQADGQTGCAELCDEEGRRLAAVRRDIRLGEHAPVRILIRDTMMEWYIDEWFMFCYTFPAGVAKVECGRDMALYQMELEDG